MFVQITDPDKAMELYRAGLLWHHFKDEAIVPAAGWYYEPERSGLPANVRKRGASWRFYILLED